MRALETLEERHVVAPGKEEHELPVKVLRRDPRRAAMLSLIPGLGQLYNGETGKGMLFLAVSLANVIVFASMIFSDELVRVLARQAASMQLTLDWDLVKTLQVFHTGSAAFLIYVGLLLSFITYAMRDAYDQARRARQGAVYAKFFLGLPEAASGSYLVHYAFIAAATTFVLFMVAPSKPAEQAIDIELIEPEKPSPPPPAPKREEPQKPEKIILPKKVELPKPVDQPKPVEKPLPNQVAVAVPTDQPAPLSLAPQGAVSDPAPAADSGASGSGDPGSTGTGDSAEIDFGPYVQEMTRRIKKAWFPPKGNESKRITVKFKIKRSGDVRSIRLIESSGLSIADNAAIAAVEQAAPFPPLPTGADDEISIKFTFDYNVFNGTSSGVRSF